MLRCLTILALLLAPVGAAAETPTGSRGEPIGLCAASPRITCVVDGDTIWYHGVKIRLADIDTPEVSHPACPFEAQLAAQATQRLIALLNAGPFAIETSGTRDEDPYGRKLRVLTRDGTSLGEQLVAEGLAERWTGRRRQWCTLPGA
jgi:micrococcal nuclease